MLSPITGDVITWQVAEKLQLRPVEKGQLLMTVADPTKEWELEIHMPEDRMGAVAKAVQSSQAGRDVAGFVYRGD